MKNANSEGYGSLGFMESKCSAAPANELPPGSICLIVLSLPTNFVGKSNSSIVVLLLLPHLPLNDFICSAVITLPLNGIVENLFGLGVCSSITIVSPFSKVPPV